MRRLIRSRYRAGILRGSLGKLINAENYSPLTQIESNDDLQLPHRVLLRDSETY